MARGGSSCTRASRRCCSTLCGGTKAQSREWLGAKMAAVPRPRLFLIDSYGFIFRAYHARARSAAPPMRTSAGLSTEAVYIFHNMLRKLVTTYKPEYIAAIFESAGPTFRDEAFADYKANRA